MNNEKILQIAARHGRSFLCGDCWEFEKDSLLDFARELIEEDRKTVPDAALPSPTTQAVL